MAEEHVARGIITVSFFFIKKKKKRKKKYYDHETVTNNVLQSWRR